MSTASIPAVSVEYVHVPITSDTTLDEQVVELAFIKTGTPSADTEWFAAEWEDTAALERTCRLLVGPGTGVVLAAGSWTVWVRVTDSVEVPVREAGRIRIQ